MNLREWMFRAGITNIELGAKINRSKTYISQIRNGASKPSRKLAEEIQRVSDGKVPMEEFGYCNPPKDKFKIQGDKSCG
jgi:transcriptional regulator with XRE-family HTH domain